MADTASPRPEPPALAPDRCRAVAQFLAVESGAGAVDLVAAKLLGGGAIQENWALDADIAGGFLAGRQALVLRAAAATGVPSSLGRIEEFAVLKAAFAAGVTVPEPLFACADPDVLGKPFLIMRRAAGGAAGHRITRDKSLDPVLPEIAERLGRELARIHAIRPPRPDLGFLPRPDETVAARQIARWRAYLDQHPVPRPVLEWGLRWLETHVPAPAAPVLCHHDFRTGNYLLDDARLTGILDWEFAGWGDPDEDIGWFCAKAWRFARLDREAGGIADRTSFYRGYESEARRTIDPQRVFFWEVAASLRWAVIALQQSDRHILGGERNLDLALTGRRATECELELLILLDGSCPVEPEAPAAARGTQLGLPYDVPRGAELLTLAREVLLDRLQPLLPAERRLDALLIGNCLAIAAREADAGHAPPVEVETATAELAMFYGLGDGGREPGAGETFELWRRFARDLRRGAFAQEVHADRPARAILWRLTLAKLRLANPRFLAANGLAEPDGSGGS
jgi:aminoglycoside phosphotransferase (APT) family kinase protein